MPSKVQSWFIFHPEQGGFRGVVLGKSNNKLIPGQCSDSYNFISNGGPEKRKGNTIDNEVELVANTKISGLFQFHDGTNYKTFAKCGSKVFDVSMLGNSPYVLTELTVEGDTDNQLSLWNLVGGGNLNTNNGILYWKLIDAVGDRTVEVYKNSDGLAKNLVATGTVTGDGEITLTSVNDSGLTGTVTVAYTADDTDLENNTLTYPSLVANDELQFLSWFNRYFFTDGKEVYFGSNGPASAMIFNDENGDPITGTHPHGKSILIYKERLWMTRDSNFPTRVYFSLVDFYNRFFTDGGANVQGWIHCEKDDGQPITGFTLYNDKIFVTKREKHYWITGEPTDNSAGTLSVSTPYPGGAYDQKTIVNCPDGFIRWWGPDGVYQYSDATGYHHISDNIDYELKKISNANKTKACAQFYENYYILMFPDGMCEYADGFAFDNRTGEWYPIKNWNISCMAKFADDTLHAGFYDKGYVCQLFSGNVDNVDAEDIECYAKTRVEKPPGASWKTFEYCLDKLQVYGVKNGQKVNLYWNATGDFSASGSWTFTYDASGDFLGEFILGDAGIPDDGSLLISVDELIGMSANPSKRMNSSQRFRDIYFEIFEKGATPHSFDFLQIDSYLIGEVR